MKKNLRIFYLLHIIRNENHLGRNPGLEELIRKLQERFPDEKTGFSERTIKRDFEQIRNNLHINISYRNGGYCANEDDFENSVIGGTIEAFEIFSAVNLQTGMPDFVIAESRKSSGVEHFHFLVKSILKKEYVGFYYEKYDSGEKNFYEIAPYALKESRHRWYVVGVIKEEKELKSFGLDRISELAKGNGKFKAEFDLGAIKQHFADSFAMFTNGKTENVVLKFDKRDGNYIKSFPIHPSQVTLAEDKNSVTFSLQIKITPDFMMELMSRAWSLEVLEPYSLREELYRIFKDAVGRNG